MTRPEIERLQALFADERHREIASLGLLIHDVARLLRRRFEETARLHGMTLPQWRVMRQLKVSDALSQVTLAGLIDSDPMTVSRMVERMENAGLVQRLADPADSRAKLVRLTPKAHAVYAEMSQQALAVYDEALRGIGKADRTALVTALGHISDNLAAGSKEQMEDHE
ncbi:MAG TPA: MarR family transcriptional regulator [Devosiaceae bacterium]